MLGCKCICSARNADCWYTVGTQSDLKC